MAGKRTLLTKAELFYIRNNPEQLTANELADELNVSLKQVQGVVYRENMERKKAREAEAAEVEAAKPVPKPNRLRGMIVATTESGKRGVSAMTPGASQVIDAANKDQRMKIKNDKTAGHIAPTYPNGRDDNN